MFFGLFLKKYINSKNNAWYDIANLRQKLAKNNGKVSQNIQPGDLLFSFKEFIKKKKGRIEIILYTKDFLDILWLNFKYAHVYLMSGMGVFVCSLYGILFSNVKVDLSTGKNTKWMLHGIHPLHQLFSLHMNFECFYEQVVIYFERSSFAPFFQKWCAL